MSSSVTKSDLVAHISAETGLKRTEAEAALVALIQAVQAALSDGNRVTLVGFGTFSVALRKEKMGRHPRTQAPMLIPARRTVKFTPGKTIKEVIQPG